MITKTILESLIKSKNPEDVSLAQSYLSDEFYRFQPRPDKPEVFDEQTSFVESKHDGINCFIAGNGSGKSVCAAYKGAKFLRETPPPVDLCKFLILSQNTRMVGSLWEEKLSRFIPQNLIQDIIWQSHSLNHPKNIILKPSANGNRWQIVFSSYEMGRKSMQSISAAGYILDEQADFNIISEIDTRCRDWSFPGSKMYVLTPLMPDQELEHRFNNNDEYKYWKFFRSNSECNTTLQDFGWLYNCPKEIYETRRIGAFLNFEGAVFPEFDPLHHVITPFYNFPEGTEMLRVIDVGFTHLTAALLIAKHENTIWVLKEWSASNMLIKDKVKNILEQMPGRHQTIVDSAAAQERAEFTKLGLPNIPATKHLELSIEWIRRRLMTKKLLIFNNCKNLITEIKNYHRKKDTGSGDLKKNDPVKRHDDHVDALRYGITYWDQHSDLTAWKSATSPTQPYRLQF